MDVASLANLDNRLYLYVASTIVDVPICDSLGCLSGMKGYATRILGSQRGFHGQGASLGHVLVQVHLNPASLESLASRCILETTPS